MIGYQILFIDTIFLPDLDSLIVQSNKFTMHLCSLQVSRWSFLYLGAMSACAKARQPDYVAKLMCLGPMFDEPESFKLDKGKGFAGVVFVWFLKLLRQDLRDKDPKGVLPNHWNSLIISCAPDGERANRAMQEGLGKCRDNPEM